MKTLEDDVEIVKELPPHLRFLDIVAVGSQVCSILSILQNVIPQIYRNMILIVASDY